MGQPQGRSRQHKNKLKQKKSFRSKRRKKDTDQIRADMLDPVCVQKITQMEPDGDLPGSGKFFCIACNRHMIDAHALKEHFRSKIHKRRIKKLQEEPYSHKEAEQAGGMGQFTPKDNVVAKTVLDNVVAEISGSSQAEMVTA
eukprot:m.335210 g.335210  ORF g.335210 m.335210 type:complete len:142 (+) comp17537_c0_seq1:177-602(+)